MARSVAHSRPLLGLATAHQEPTVRSATAPARPRGQSTMTKRTFQPHNVSRLRTHGFRHRNSTRGGQDVLKNRRRKGRWRLSVTAYKK